SRPYLKQRDAQTGMQCTAQGICAAGAFSFPNPSRLTGRVPRSSRAGPASSRPTTTPCEAPPNRPLNLTKGPDASRPADTPRQEAARGTPEVTVVVTVAGCEAPSPALWRIERSPGPSCRSPGLAETLPHRSRSPYSSPECPSHGIG